jgi:hypothetical protein
MPRYRCFFVDDRDKVESFEPFSLGDEAAAVKRAEDMLLLRPWARYAELWESGHLVARIDPPRDRT